MTDDRTGSYWALGDGDPVVDAGIDNGALAPLVWLTNYPGYPAYVGSTWRWPGGIDGCIDFAQNPRCMAILLMDKDANTGAGAFAVLTDKEAPLGNYDFSQPGDIVLTSLPAPRITHSLAILEPRAVQLSVAGLTEDDIAGGIYLDPECLPRHPIAGYRLFVQERGSADPAPDDSAVDDWTAAAVVPLGDPFTLVAPCGTGVSLWLAYGIEFDSGYRSVYVSEPSTRIECGTNLADPAERPSGRERPQSRERPAGAARSRSRG